jgi:hypothetical protein
MGRGHHGSIARRPAGLCVGLFLLGCTEFEPGTDELTGTTEVTDQLTPGVGRDWSCVGSVPTRSFGTDPGAAITYTLRTLDLGTLDPIPDMTVRVCALTDVECDMPVIDRLEVDAEGWVDVPLTENFSGYLELESPTTVPGSLYLGGGLRTMTEFPLLMITVPAFQGLMAAVGVTEDPAAGHVSIRTFDCQSDTAPGATLSNNTGGVPFYFINGLPDITLRETDDDGLGGYVNVPAGVTSVQSRLADGTLVDRRSFIVRPGWFVSSFMRPAGFQPPAP